MRAHLTVFLALVKAARGDQVGLRCTQRNRDTEKLQALSPKRENRPETVVAGEIAQ